MTYNLLAAIVCNPQEYGLKTWRSDTVEQSKAWHWEYGYLDSGKRGFPSREAALEDAFGRLNGIARQAALEAAFDELDDPARQIAFAKGVAKMQEYRNAWVKRYGNS